MGHEIAITTITLIAFMLPLRKLLKNAKLYHNNQEKHTLKFKLAAIKVTILTLTALLSSFGSLVIVGTTSSANIVFFDMTLNVLCIILMTPYYKGWYKKLCCCCIRTCILCCSCNSEQQRMYAISVNTGSTYKDTNNGNTNTPYSIDSGSVNTPRQNNESQQDTVTAFSGNGDSNVRSLEVSQQLNKTELVDISTQ